jgi:SPP1 family predicted phage head-tail adaptor
MQTLGILMIATSPADLDKRITLQYQTKVSDGGGSFVTVWTDAATVWAAIWPVSAKEIVQANATTMVVSHRIRIRYRSVLKAAWRVKFGNRYFSIVGITSPNEAREWIDIMAKEGVA